MNKKLISIVIPSYNEEKNVTLLYNELKNVLWKVINKYEYEIIYVNDGSSDNTWEEIKKLCNNDKKVKWINLSRNFWHQGALTAWFANVNWDAIISMDCDMQDPPYLLLDMIKKWEEGYEIVYARRKKRNDNFLKKYTAILYYKIHSKISDIEIPRNVWDFRLVSKKVLKQFLKLSEKDRYIRWMFAWLGFRYTFIDFERPERNYWETWYTWKKMIKLAMDWILNFSMFPLKLGLFLWVIVIFMSISFTIYMLYDFFINNVYYPLYKWLVNLIFWFVWLQFIFMWILGEYIWRIYNETRNRPIYIEDEKINF